MSRQQKSLSSGMIRIFQCVSLLRAVSDMSCCYAHHDQILLKFTHSKQQNMEARYQPTSKRKIVYFLQLMLSPAGSCLFSSLPSQAALSIPGPVQSLPHTEVSRAGQGDGEENSSALPNRMSQHTAETSFPVISANCSWVHLFIIMEAGNIA